MAMTRPAGEADRPPPGLWHRRLAQWIALSQYGFPFAIGRARTPLMRLRSLARRARFANAPILIRVPLAVAMTLLWPLGAFTTSLRAGREARAQGRDYGPRQLGDMVALALRHSIPPLEYVLYRFEEPARRARMHDYLYWNDLPGQAALCRRAGADNRDVQDKSRFAEICVAHDLPCVETLAVFENGQQTFPHEPFVPTRPELWTKALRLKGAAGGARWTREGRLYRDAAGRKLTPDELASEFRKADCLVQPFVENHPAIAAASNGALASLRIVTGTDGKGATDYVTSLLALPHGSNASSVAALLCSIDPHTGLIRRAAMPDGTEVTHHPDTGRPLPGLAIPFWQESNDLVLAAHAAAFAKFPFLGWDVALTAEGPLLLETNSGWGALFHQMIDGPLADTAFPRLLGQWL